MPKENAGRRRAEVAVSTTWWEELSARSDRPDAREEITRLIRQGQITVRPCPGDPERVRLSPCGRGDASLDEE
jgi:hypothetical protein